MKLEDGKVLIDTKIEELTEIIKKQEKAYKKDYFKEQVLPKTVAALIPIVSEYYILKSDIPTELKLSLNIPVAMYVAVAIIISYFFGQDYHFNSLDKNKLERIKRIKKYLDNNINILDDVDVKDFEWHIANINDDLQIPEEFKKQKKLQKKL